MTNQEKRTAIYLTDEEIEVWKWSSKNYSIIRKIITLSCPAKLVLNLNSKGDAKPELTIFGKNGIEKLTA